MSKVNIVGSVLKWARESSNISVEEVATRLKKDPEIIKNWEEEKDFPTYVQLEKLAYTIYKRPIALFFFPEPPDEPDPRKSFRTLPEFERENLSTSVIHLIRKAQVMILNLKDLCEGKNPTSKIILNEIEIESTEKTFNISNKLRTAIGIDLEEQIKWKDYDEAFDNWRSAFQDNGIFVFKEAFYQDEISGFCLYDKEFPIIYINNTLPKTRQIFTLFHELGHLLMKTSGIVKYRDDFINSLSLEDRRIEIFCNQLTGEFLVPDNDFNTQLESIDEIDDNSISEIADRYFVSREVILRKILDRKMIDSKTYEDFVSRWSKQAIESRERRKGKGGNYYATKAVYLGEKYLDLVFSQYYSNKINLDKVADYLNIKVSKVTNFEDRIILKTR